MSNLRRRLERAEHQLEMSARAGRDRASCPECRNFDAHFAPLGVRVGNQCPGHPELTPAQAKAEYDKAFRDLCNMLGISIGADYKS
jgi:hypothetical protein